MGNMNYCKFRNTLGDLRDCMNEIFDKCKDEDEDLARLRIIRLCCKVAEDEGYAKED